MNYFRLLDVEQEYTIDQNFLHKQYLNKQKFYHPDRAKNDSERAECVSASIDINKAYKVLKDDYLRAEYLLTLLGQKFDDEHLKNLLSHEEFEEIMESYEIIDDTDSIPELNHIMEKKLSQKKTVIAELTESFKQNNITKALDLTIRLKYLTNLVGNIRSKIQTCR
ncbi:Fe-S protein assembly co-chaperone HscB [Rickettsiaceae bacterium]|nr:Fe-S protein assembly co-chaperone HscB [Rickettsiaceae bacterium]